MSKKIIWITALCTLCFLAASFYWFYQKSNNKTSDTTIQSSEDRRGSNKNGRAISVQTTRAKRGDIDLILNAPATVTARSTSIVKARVDGQLERIYFHEGQVVKQASVLAELDARPFQIQLEQAKAQLAKDEALLINAKLDLQRFQNLLKKDSIATQQVDTQTALVAQYEANVKASRAQVDNAKLQLSFTRITAPISGRLGLRQVDVGNMIHTSDANGLVSITNTQPIDLIFSVSAKYITQLTNAVRKNSALRVDAIDQDGKTKLASGTVLSLDNQIDSATGTIKIKAQFSNEDAKLFPNQFVNAHLYLETQKNVVLIPSNAIQQGAETSLVYIVDAQNKVRIRSVQTGIQNEEQVVITQGIEEAEQVIIDGTDKLREGSSVRISKMTKPETQQKPPHKKPIKNAAAHTHSD